MGPVVDAETGFQYLRARYYDPATGQFLTRDPIEAQSREAYGYVGGNPLNATDPSGLFRVPGTGWCVGHCAKDSDDPKPEDEPGEDEPGPVNEMCRLTGMSYDEARDEILAIYECIDSTGRRWVRVVPVGKGSGGPPPPRNFATPMDRATSLLPGSRGRNPLQGPCLLGTLTSRWYQFQL